MEIMNCRGKSCRGDVPSQYIVSGVCHFTITYYSVALPLITWFRWYLPTVPTVRLLLSPFHTLSVEACQVPATREGRDTKPHLWEGGISKNLWTPC